MLNHLKPIILVLFFIHASRVLSMDNYDNPRLEKGFLNSELSGNKDIIKVTLETNDENIEARFYFRSAPSGNSLDQGYLFKFSQNNTIHYWLTVVGENGALNTYPLQEDHTAKSNFVTANSDFIVDGVQISKTLRLFLPMSMIDFNQMLSYQLETVRYLKTESGFKVVEIYDSSSRFRGKEKTINPIQLFNRMCTGRA